MLNLSILLVYHRGSDRLLLLFLFQINLFVLRNFTLFALSVSYITGSQIMTLNIALSRFRLILILFILDFRFLNFLRFMCWRILLCFKIWYHFWEMFKVLIRFPSVLITWIPNPFHKIIGFSFHHFLNIKSKTFLIIFSIL